MLSEDRDKLPKAVKKSQGSIKGEGGHYLSEEQKTIGGSHDHQHFPIEGMECREGKWISYSSTDVGLDICQSSLCLWVTCV